MSAFLGATLGAIFGMGLVQLANRLREPGRDPMGCGRLWRLPACWVRGHVNTAGGWGSIYCFRCGTQTRESA